MGGVFARYKSEPHKLLHRHQKKTTVSMKTNNFQVFLKVKISSGRHVHP